jgi:HPt (histidine-containing phosphotransfer) domain-containing protein
MVSYGVDFDTDPEMFRLREEFIDSLPARRERLAALSTTQEREELRRLVHSLAGVAGAYGFDRLGRIAGDFDDWFDGGAPAELASWISKLDEALGEAIRRRAE